MGWCSGSAVCVLVVNGQCVAVDTVCDIDRDILGAHCARNDGQVWRVTRDGRRCNVVGCTVVEALGMGWCSGSAVCVLVVNGQCVAVDTVCDIDRDILGAHCARNDGQVWRVTRDGRRCNVVGCTVVEALGMGWCSGSAVCVLVVNGQCVAVDTVSYINRHVLVTHRARDDGQVRRVACDRR